jgi:CDGSH-type Zn-finger protein
MPEVERAEKNGHIRHTVKIQPNEKVMLCRCYKSATFPFCDVSHRHTADELGPIIVEVVQETEEPKAES